jgi:hypothetical protein
VSYRHTRDWKAIAVIGVIGFPLYILASCTDAKAQTIDGNRMHAWCGEAMPLASGYVTGVVDGLYSVQQARFCLPSTGIVKQNVDVVCKGLVDHPEYRAFDASVLTHAFLAEAFPCQ